MWKLVIFLVSLILPQWSLGQPGGVKIKVYDFDDGLSHRNVFKVLQDTAGVIWVATINGLNAFDGYQFTVYNSHKKENYIPHDVISDMVIDSTNRIWLANPDFISSIDPNATGASTFQIKEGEIVRRQSRVPHNLFKDRSGRLWYAGYDEFSGDTYIETLRTDSTKRTLFKVKGQYTKRPIVQWQNHFYIGAYEEELWVTEADGTVIDTINFSPYRSSAAPSRIVQLQVQENYLWVLLIDGQLLKFSPNNGKIEPHPVNASIKGKDLVSSLLVEREGDVWIGGRGRLWHYDAEKKRLFDHDPTVRQIIKNTCYYRQIFADRTGVIWVATDFGVVKLTRSRNLFTNYLKGGSEYCSNTYCSIRGIAEDETGNLYFSYYNSIHFLDPADDELRPLFPANDYFNYPFGLLYHNNALWTGNGRRIDLKTLRIDTLFNRKNVDMGAVMKDSDSNLWFGYLEWLHKYDTATGALQPFRDQYGEWQSRGGVITHLHQGRTPKIMWVSTLENGIYQVDRSKGRLFNFHDGPDSRVRLAHKQVNAAYEDSFNNLWLATGLGLHKIDLSNDSLCVYTTENGLPNDFINGLLPEGDSCLWVSTDHGLCRFSIRNQSVTNFFVQDGLSSNEFNRISFHKAKDGRMYFGGLNGVNAFYPGARFVSRRAGERLNRSLFTRFTNFNSAEDSLFVTQRGLYSGRQLNLNHNDKYFTISFALANYEDPQNNHFTYILDGYEQEWSPPSSLNNVRYNNIPPGKYTFKVKAKPGNKEWIDPIRLEIIIREAFYRTWWFLGSCIFLLIAGVWGMMKYRIHLVHLREKSLEEQVKVRTQELESEKHKSEQLLLNILPAEIAEELKNNGFAKAKRHELVTVMFSDFKSFTKISEKMEPEELVAEIDLCFRAFDEIIGKYHLEKIKTIGDAYLCVGGIAGSGTKQAISIVEAALDIQDFLKRTAKQKQAEHDPFFEARIGIHTGPIVAGIVGIKKFAYDIWGDTVNVASRMETKGKVGEVNISEATYRLVKDHFHCRSHGVYQEETQRPINMFYVEKKL